MNILIRITDQKVLCLYIHVYQIIKNGGPGPYNFLCYADNRKYFSGLSLTHFTWPGKWEKSGDVLAEKKVILS